MPDTFVSPYDDFERYLRSEMGVEEKALVIPVLFRLSVAAQARLDDLAAVLVAQPEDQREEQVVELKGLIAELSSTLESFEDGTFSADLQYFLGQLEIQMTDGTPEMRNFLGRVVIYVPDLEAIDAIKARLVLPSPDEGSSEIRLLEELWIGPVVAHRLRDELQAGLREKTLQSGGPKIGKPVVGIIDDAIGFLNQAFRNREHSRFDAIWLQKRPTLLADGLDLGPELTGEFHIDELLERIRRDDRHQTDVEMEIYQEFNKNVYDVDFFEGTNHDHTHGTHMLGLAVDDVGAKLRQFERDILAVQLPPFSLRDMTGHYLSFFAFLGLRWMLRRMVTSFGLDAINSEAVRPLILNISLGYFAGPKDGSGNFEREFSREVDSYEAATGGRVTAFFSYGNYYNQRQIATAEVAPGKTAMLSWELQSNDPTASFLELRSDKEFAVSITHSYVPGGTPELRPASGTYDDIKLQASGVNGRVYGNVTHRYHGDTLSIEEDGLVIALRPTRGDIGGYNGYWRIWIHGLAEQAKLTCQVQSGGTPPSYLGYHEHGKQSKFEEPQSSATVALTHAGSFSALVPVTDNKHRSAGAAALVNPADPHVPMHYASEGGLFPAGSSPTLSSVVQSDAGKDGLWGHGTISGTRKKTGGSSAAAAVAANEFVKVVYALHERSATFDKYPGPVDLMQRGDARLGNWTIA